MTVLATPIPTSPLTVRLSRQRSTRTAALSVAALPAPVPVPVPVVPPVAAAPTTEPDPPTTAGGCDEILLARLAAGNADAWRTVVERYRPLVCAAARRVVSGQADVEEAAQRTWLALWRNAGAVREAARLPGWLGVTARREALAMVRRRREVLVADIGVLDHVSRSPVAQASTSPIGSSASSAGAFTAQDCSVLVERAERARYLRLAVERLPERQRLLMRALLADRTSYDELSRTLNIPRGSIGPMRARALRSLRVMMQTWEP